jgi:UDP:flavonoid glycosyltransferase YjiC (YdhE family)
VILPAWLDLYGFAQLSETIGVGVWGCRETSPYWTTECLYEAILRVLRSDESAAMQEKAKKLSALAQARPGRYIAAKEIAKLAGSGV